MRQRKRTTPDDENGNPFRTLGDFLREKVSVVTLATAIEQHGIYTWDRFGKFGPASESDRTRALSLLEAQYKWENDPTVSLLEDSRSPLERSEDDWDDPFESFGWAAEVAPNFDNIQKALANGKLVAGTDVHIRAPQKFAAAFVKLCTELSKRDPKFNTDEMPGQKSDLLELAIKFDPDLDHTLETFKTYIKGLCKFKQSPKPSGYYRSKFPEYFTSN
jgi:hypothetical protein